MTPAALRHLRTPGLATGWLALALALGAQAQAPAAQMPTAPTPPAAPAPAPAAQAPAAPVAAAPGAPQAASKTASKTAPKAAAAGCSVAEFRTLALDTHTPLERSALATHWLLKHGPGCNEEQILMIRANRALWLGVADTVAMMGLVDRIVEARQSGRPDALQSLYAAPTPDRVGTLDVQRVNGGLRPVVPPPAPVPMVLGAQVQVPGMAPPGVPPARPGAMQ